MIFKENPIFIFTQIFKIMNNKSTKNKLLLFFTFSIFQVLEFSNLWIPNQQIPVLTKRVNSSNYEVYMRNVNFSNFRIISGKVEDILFSNSNWTFLGKKCFFSRESTRVFSEIILSINSTLLRILWKLWIELEAVFKTFSISTFPTIFFWLLISILVLQG